MTDFRSTTTFRMLKSAKHKLRNLYNERSGKRPRIPVDKTPQALRTLGTEYGGWTFVEDPSLSGSTIISCGAGEDISFDVLFSATYGAKVIIVDPTPRAAAHVKAVIQQMQKARQEGTLSSLELYGLRGFSQADPRKLVLVERALWKDRGCLKFFPPQNPDHVSYSALNYQHGYTKTDSFIEVDALSYQDLIDEFCVKEVPLLKLDIEGAEVEVLTSLSEADVLPKQICVEYDELFKPNRVAASRVRGAHDHLVHLGYTAIHSDTLGVNFLYIKKI